jgi:hypothetical protein
MAALIGISLGMLGAFMSHCFAIVALLPFFAAELVRTVDRKKVDRGVWAALLLPLPALALYYPLMRSHSRVLILPEFITSWTKVAGFYQLLLQHVGSAIVPGVVIGVIVARNLGKGQRTSGVKPVPRQEKALIGCLLLTPVWIHLLESPSGGQFWSRYSIAVSFGFALLVVHLLAAETAGSRVAAAVAVSIAFCTLLCLDLGPYTFAIDRSPGPPLQTGSYTTVSPELPFVVANRMTFLEMNRYENPSFLSRVHYLLDPDACLHYLHSNEIPAYPTVAEWFPIRAQLSQYSEFVQRHRHFLILAAVSDPLQWLTPKLMDSGARLRFLGEFKTVSFRANQSLFEVTMPGD